MIPVVTPEEMAGVDAAAPEGADVLIGRAAAAVASAAVRLMGGSYGRRVVVVAGPGHNGADGRLAATMLERRGVRTLVLDAADLGGGAQLPAADLVVDAAFGTGLSRPWRAPDPGAAPVLAVDITSGLSGLTGRVVGGDEGRPLRARATVTFAAPKPGLLVGDGPALSGVVDVADIGLGALVTAAARAWLVTDADVVAHLPRRPAEAQKYTTSVAVVAGSPGMSGAPWMVSRAAMRAGAGYVRLGIPGVEPGRAGLPPGELVSVALPGEGWDEEAAAGLDRFRALVVGPGLGASGRGPGGSAGPDTPVARLLVAAADRPAVVDADGINALGTVSALAEVVARRRAPTVITPHDGEYARLVGHPPGEDRLADVRDVARRSGAVVLLKGSTTVVAEPGGRVLLSAAGSSRLASAGTGDVLSGVIGAFLARGVAGAEAAALAAHVHGRAAGSGRSEGLVASDLPDLVSSWLSGTMGPGPVALTVRAGAGR